MLCLLYLFTLRYYIGTHIFPDVLLNDIAGPDGNSLLLSMKLAVDVLVSTYLHHNHLLHASVPRLITRCSFPGCVLSMCFGPCNTNCNFSWHFPWYSFVKLSSNLAFGTFFFFNFFMHADAVASLVLAR